jgi:hypothetical protein
VTPRGAHGSDQSAPESHPGDPGAAGALRESEEIREPTAQADFVSLLSPANSLADKLASTSSAVRADAGEQSAKADFV